MHSLQLATVIVTCITLALVSTVMIILSVAWARKPCEACPPCPESNLNVDRVRMPPPLPQVPPQAPPPPQASPPPQAPPPPESVEMPRADFSFF